MRLVAESLCSKFLNLAADGPRVCANGREAAHIDAGCGRGGAGGSADALARATITPNWSDPPAGTGVVVRSLDCVSRNVSQGGLEYLLLGAVQQRQKPRTWGGHPLYLRVLC
jgi:hypothetical protein